LQIAAQLDGIDRGMHYGVHARSAPARTNRAGSRGTAGRLDNCRTNKRRRRDTYSYRWLPMGSAQNSSLSCLTKCTLIKALSRSIVLAGFPPGYGSPESQRGAAAGAASVRGSTSTEKGRSDFGDRVSADVVRLFLRHLEESRKRAVATRNQRLAAIDSLARFVGLHSPEHIEWCGQFPILS
jgi:hypothetical protein